MSVIYHKIYNERILPNYLFPNMNTDDVISSCNLLKTGSKKEKIYGNIES